jgi:hypothetical protein
MPSCWRKARISKPRLSQAEPSLQASRSDLWDQRRMWTVKSLRDKTFVLLHFYGKLVAVPIAVNLSIKG